MSEEQQQGAVPDWLRQSIHERIQEVSESHPFVQTFLLLKILDRLESIDETLCSLFSDYWDRHHG